MQGRRLSSGPFGQARAELCGETGLHGAAAGTDAAVLAVCPLGVSGRLSSGGFCGMFDRHLRVDQKDDSVLSFLAATWLFDPKDTLTV